VFLDQELAGDFFFFYWFDRQEPARRNHCFSRVLADFPQTRQRPFGRDRADGENPLTDALELTRRR
jgi:hypothetical protein